MALEFSAEAKQTIASLIQRYPSKQPVVMAALHLAKKEFGDLRDEALHVVAAELDLPYTHVFGVKTFYTMYKGNSRAKNTLRVCTNISCMLRGAYEVLEAIEKHTGLSREESDDNFHIVEEECLAACANAPMILCGTKYFLDVEPGQVPEILEYLEKNPHPESEVV